MPLSTPSPRHKVHRREVTCEGFERDDGLWDIEGRMTDVKTYAIPNKDRGGRIAAGEPLHDMAIRLTIDLDFRIHAVEAVIDYAPHAICPRITGVFQQLVGVTIAPGWSNLTKRLFSGIKGCTHLMELLGPIATTAFQATYRARADRRSATQASRPGLLNSCHAMAQNSPVVRENWPDYYRQEEAG